MGYFVLGGKKLNLEKDNDKHFSKVGILLITLVITIIVIIILAAIVLFSSLTTVDNANYATFVSEYDEINSATQATLKNNVLNGNSEAERNAGFTKAKVENAPGSFVSVSEDSISGYEKEKYTVIYDANGGSGAPEAQSAEEGTNLTISTQRPTWDSNHIFKGWSASEDKQVVEYQPGDTYSGNATATLYAVWESNLIPSIANGPRLNTDEMVAVYWSDENASVEQTDTSFEIPNSGGLYNTTLYNYNINEEAYLSGIDTYSVEWAQKPRWANAKTSDGSYWVWIPRYAYKLIYYTNSNRTIESSIKTAYGDAVYETSPSYSSYGWCADYSYFPYSNIPFFKRGGNYDDTNSAGVFDFYDDNGGDDSYGVFRPVVCVSPGT